MILQIIIKSQHKFIPKIPKIPEIMPAFLLLSSKIFFGAVHLPHLLSRLAKNVYYFAEHMAFFQVCALNAHRGVLRIVRDEV